MSGFSMLNLDRHRRRVISKEVGTTIKPGPHPGVRRGDDRPLGQQFSTTVFRLSSSFYWCVPVPSPPQAGYTGGVLGDIDKVLISREQIATRVRELGNAIRQDLDDLHRNEGGEIVVVPVLTGSIIFVADLMRELPYKMRINVIAASSYPG